MMPYSAIAQLSIIAAMTIDLRAVALFRVVRAVPRWIEDGDLAVTCGGGIGGGASNRSFAPICSQVCGTLSTLSINPTMSSVL
jgi:hypothetical protein